MSPRPRLLLLLFPLLAGVRCGSDRERAATPESPPRVERSESERIAKSSARGNVGRSLGDEQPASGY